MVLRPGARDVTVASSWIGCLSRKGEGRFFILERDNWPFQVPEATWGTVGNQGPIFKDWKVECEPGVPQQALYLRLSALV